MASKTTRSNLLCPVDFSEASRSALRYAIAVAKRFDTGLTLLTVDDPILMEAAHAVMGPAKARENSERELRRFLADTPESAGLVEVRFAVATGKPAVEILRAVGGLGCDLIVMSTHGRTGPKKLFFGATAERVLRETTVPVLVAPAAEQGPVSVEAMSAAGRPVLVPLDFSDATDGQMAVARRVAAALRLPLLLTHVIEPLTTPLPAELDFPDLAAARIAQAQAALSLAGQATAAGTPWESTVEVGVPAEAIARVALERQAGLIVIGLHASAAPGPRMGSVTYRVLCLAPVPTLALPPASPATWLN